MSERFTPVAFRDMDILLTERFQPHKEEFIALIPKLEEPEAKSFLNTMLKSLGENLKAEIIGAKESIQAHLSSVRDDLAKAKSQLNTLVELQGKIGDDRNRLYKLHLILYIVLILGAILVFASTNKLIFPEQNVAIGVIQAIVLAAPSYLILCYYNKCLNKDTMLLVLHIIGISAATGLAIFAAFARGVAYYMLNHTSTSDSVFSEGSMSGLEKLHITAAGLTFFFCVITEIVFAGRLMIEIHHSKEARSKADSIVDEIRKCKESILSYEEYECMHCQQLEQANRYGDILVAWCEAKIQEMLVLYRSEHERLKGDAISRLYNLPTRELFRILNIANREE